MFGHTYFHDTLRKYVIYFGTLFNDVYINRTNATGETISTIRVPLSYGPKEKFIGRVDGDPALNKPVAITLPRMAFEMLNFKYDKSRHLSTIGQRVKAVEDDQKLRYIYNPVPYNIEFKLYIMVKNPEDGTRIVEQILPFFTPEWTATLNLIPEAGIKHDVPVVLTDVQVKDVYEGNFTERRALIWTLSFTMKAYLYGPTKDSKIIKAAIANMFTATNVTIAEAINNDTVAERYTVTPGLTANGEPTSNSAQSIPASQINPSDNYGYITEFQSFI